VIEHEGHGGTGMSAALRAAYADLLPRIR
jgi:hypothetical protein